jgi:hypothetical protein
VVQHDCRVLPEAAIGANAGNALVSVAKNQRKCRSFLSATNDWLFAAPAHSDQAPPRRLDSAADVPNLSNPSVGTTLSDLKTTVMNAVTRLNAATALMGRVRGFDNGRIWPGVEAVFASVTRTRRTRRGGRVAGSDARAAAGSRVPCCRSCLGRECPIPLLSRFTDQLMRSR